MAQEIDQRIEQIPYQHREELFNNLLWLAQTGEQAIPTLIAGLSNPAPKVRSNCAWVLGQIGDRRTIPELRQAMNDRAETVSLEAARSLVAMGDMEAVPELIRGLDSDKIQVRYLCHEALKASTRRDFDYDHLSDDVVARTEAVYHWRQWWSKQSGDEFFAQSYAADHGLQADGTPRAQWETPAAPQGETAPQTDNPPQGEKPVTEPSEESNETPATEETPETEEGVDTDETNEPQPATPAVPAPVTEVIEESVESTDSTN